MVLTLGMVCQASGQDRLNQPQLSSTTKAISSTSSAVRVNADLVLVPVTVFDSKDRIVNGLRPNNFLITDNRRPQRIKYFSQEDAPISMTIVFDSSGSMVGKVPEARAAALQLLQDANQQDEFSLVVFGNEPRIAVGFSEPVDEISRIVDSVQPDGFTSLWDALYLAVKEQKHAKYSRRAIVVISDGGDNHSRYTEGEIKSVLREADVQLYAIGLFARFLQRPEERLGPLRLDEITGVTGGRAICIHDPADIMRAARDISYELRNQYVLGYRPSEHRADGKWRAVKVQLTDFFGRGRVRVNARSGYYGPTG